MPRRLLREPHLLAHELRTPLSVISGWCSLIRDGDVRPDATPQEWERAMAACEEAVQRLNLIISQACDEAEALKHVKHPQVERIAALLETTSAAIGHSRRVLAHVQQERVRRGHDQPLAPPPL